MAENRQDRPDEDREAFSRQIGEKAARKLKARRHASRTIWHGLGMMGLVGWSVAVPTLLGAALGLWLDRHSPAPHSWTLSLLLLGLLLGCLVAWQWVARENKKILEEREDHDV